MAIVICPECAEKIREEESVCPKCGFRRTREENARKDPEQPQPLTFLEMIGLGRF